LVAGREDEMARSWKRIDASTYELGGLPDGTARLAKVGRTWTLSLGTRSADLPRRASFDHAEGQLVAWGQL
jgi:hypothetical protein